MAAQLRAPLNKPLVILSPCCMVGFRGALKLAPIMLRGTSISGGSTHGLCQKFTRVSPQKAGRGLSVLQLVLRRDLWRTSNSVSATAPNYTFFKSRKPDIYTRILLIFGAFQKYPLHFPHRFIGNSQQEQCR